MFNIQPGQGLGFAPSKEIALGLGIGFGLPPAVIPEIIPKIPEVVGAGGLGVPIGEAFIKAQLLHREDKDVLEIIIQAILSEILN